MSDKLAKDLLGFLNKLPADKMVARYKERIEQGGLTIQEDPESHFCLYFAPYDPKTKTIFIGHHKKSGLWLFNGGHIDEGETARETLVREIGEEWGLNGNDFKAEISPLLTITRIDNPTKQTCKEHFDIWIFIPVDKDSFSPQAECLAEEFYETGWKSIHEAKELIRDEKTLSGVAFIADNYF